MTDYDSTLTVERIASAMVMRRLTANGLFVAVPSSDGQRAAVVEAFFDGFEHMTLGACDRARGGLDPDSIYELSVRHLQPARGIAPATTVDDQLTLAIAGAILRNDALRVEVEDRRPASDVNTLEIYLTKELALCDTDDAFAVVTRELCAEYGRYYDAVTIIEDIHPSRNERRGRIGTELHFDVLYAQSVDRNGNIGAVNLDVLRRAVRSAWGVLEDLAL